MSDPLQLKFLEVHRSPTNGLIQILDDNVIGTPGQSMLYQHMGVRDKISRIADPYFVNLKKGNALVGTCCFCKREILNATQAATAFYIRYFSFVGRYRRKQLVGKRAFRQSALRDEIRSVLEGRFLGMPAGEKFCHYAYVDPRNVRSVVLCREFGFEPVRDYATIVFSRASLQERSSPVVTRLSADEEPLVKQLLSDFYRDYNMFSFENLLNGRHYYVLRDPGGNVVAGAQVNADRWKIHALPTRGGNFLLCAGQILPYLGRLFNRDYRFLAIDGIFFRPGCEKDLELLFATLLARYQVHSAITIVDTGSELYRVLKSLDLGPIDKLNREVRGNVICKFAGFSDDDRLRFKTHPAYISGIDVT